MLVPNRHGSSESYRYGFQGQEKDDEVKGEGNSLNYTYRMHDARVGRFFAVDPLFRKYAWNSPYSFSSNRVLDRNELEGLETGPQYWMVHTPTAKQAGMTPEMWQNQFSKLPTMEAIHGLLDAAGFVPGLGEIADGVNAIIYTYEGDHLNAAFSSISLVPLGGDVTAKGFKYSLKVAGFEGRTFKTTGAAVKWLGNAMEFGVKSADAIANRSKLKDVIKISTDMTAEGFQAHHIIPVDALKRSDAIQDAVDAGFDFNGKNNGIAMKSLKKGGEHANHPKYTDQIVKFMNDWKKETQKAGTYTTEVAKEKLEDVVKQVNTQLESIKGTGEKVNDLKLIIE
jgi:RHS repeat-associated protein